MILVDSHAHLDDRKFDTDRAEVLERAFASDVRTIITVGTDLDSSRAALSLACQQSEEPGLRARPRVLASVGVHPHDASTVNSDTLIELEHLARQASVVAVGEIGLDFYRNLSPPATQKHAFIEQLELARRVGKPVVIHDRDAHSDLLAILRTVGSEWRGVLHCFSGDEEMARDAMQMGFYLSFAGPVTFDNARRLQAVARFVPLDRMLIETDCPYLSPSPNRGQRNEPSFVRLVAAKIAELKGVDGNLVAELTTANAARLFGLPPLPEGNSCQVPPGHRRVKIRSQGTRASGST